MDSVRPTCEYLIAKVKANASSWVVWERPVKCCLSERAPDQCNIYFGTNIAVLVISINLAKLIGFVLVCFTTRKNAPLFTIGVAVSSFMGTPDETTKSIGVVSKQDLPDHTGTIFPKRPESYWGSESKGRWMASVGSSQIAWGDTAVSTQSVSFAS